MSKFKAGDRAIAYETGGPLLGTVNQTSDAIVELILDHDNSYRAFHEKQLRRLKPKAPRRRIYVDSQVLDTLKRYDHTFVLVSRVENSPTAVEFVEVRKNKKVGTK